ncbi:MAG: hypothetical protein WAP03_24725 [Methylorubrum rhodinum]|uniref:hypothetical protein n=1 Tax=Methylorubrum rhodinum TaxID=29428 RepID=UPI001055ED8C
MFSNAAYLAFLAYVVISPFVAVAALGSDAAFHVVAALNFGLTVGWALGTGSLKIEIGFRPSPKPDAPSAELTPGAVVELPAGKAASRG